MFAEFEMLSKLIKEWGYAYCNGSQISGKKMSDKRLLAAIDIMRSLIISTAIDLPASQSSLEKKWLAWVVGDAFPRKKAELMSDAIGYWSALNEYPERYKSTIKCGKAGCEFSHEWEKYVIEHMQSEHGMELYKCLHSGCGARFATT